MATRLWCRRTHPEVREGVDFEGPDDAGVGAVHERLASDDARVVDEDVHLKRPDR